MMTSFARLLADLGHGEVDFVLVGGLACVLNGHVRTTEDVDILIEPSPANVRRLLDVLAAWGEGFARELSVADFAIEPGAVRIVEAFPLDVFTELAGLTWTDLQPHVRWFRSAELAVRYLDPAGLIATKRASARAKDQEDVRVLGRLAAGR